MKTKENSVFYGLSGAAPHPVDPVILSKKTVVLLTAASGCHKNLRGTAVFKKGEIIRRFAMRAGPSPHASSHTAKNNPDP